MAVIFPDEFTEKPTIEGTENFLIDGAKKFIIASVLKAYINDFSLLDPYGVVYFDGTKFNTIDDIVIKSGRLGVNLTDPAVQLDVNGHIRGTVFTVNPSSSYSGIIIARSGSFKGYVGTGDYLDASKSNDIIVSAYASGNVHIFTNGIERLTIKSDGKINIRSIPTSNAGLSSGDIWSDGGILKIV